MLYFLENNSFRRFEELEELIQRASGDLNTLIAKGGGVFIEGVREEVSGQTKPMGRGSKAHAEERVPGETLNPQIGKEIPTDEVRDDGIPQTAPDNIPPLEPGPGDLDLVAEDHAIARWSDKAQRRVGDDGGNNTPYESPSSDDRHRAVLDDHQHRLRAQERRRRRW